MKLRHLFLALVIPIAAVASPADFNAAPGYGTQIDSSKGEVSIEQIVLASETVELDGRHLLAFNATLRNLGGGYQDEVSFEFALPSADWPVELVTGGVAMDDLPPNSSMATTPSPVTLRCAAADALMVRTAILAGEHVLARSTELFQFTLPVTEVDAVTDAAYSSALQVLPNVYQIDFATATPLLSALVPGRLLIENPAGHVLTRPALNQDPTTPGLYQWIYSAEAFGPHDEGKEHKAALLEVTSVTVLAGGVIRVTGTRREMLAVLAAGIFIKTQLDAYDSPVRDPYNPTLGRTLATESEEVRRQEEVAAARSHGKPRDGTLAELMGLLTLHYPFNEVRLARGITLDGEFLLRGLNVGVEITFRSAQINKVAVTLSSRMEVDMRLTAEAGANNEGGALFEKERTIVSVPLPPIVVPIGEVPLTIQPVLSVKVGCSVNVPTRIVVPVQCSIESGYRMGWDNSRPPGSKYFFVPFNKQTPISTSKPTLAEALTAGASVWAEGNIALLFNEVIGPQIGVRATGTFTLAPLSDPWWTVTADLTGTAGFRFQFLGLTIAEATAPLFPPINFLTRTAGGPYIPDGSSGPLANAEGDHVRWARAIRWGAGEVTAAACARVAGTAEDVFVAMHSSLAASTVMRVNGKGDLVWSLGALVFSPQHIASTPDGGFILAGPTFGNSIFISRHDGNGNLLWTRDRILTDDTGAVQTPYLRKIIVRETGAGAFDIYLAGDRPALSNVLDTDPFLIKYDSAGTMQWSKHYTSADGEHVGDATLLHDGNILFCGTHNLSPDGNNPPGPGAADGGWLMKVDANGGSLWARRTGAGLGMAWYGVTESPDGTIYTTGTHVHTVFSAKPALQVGKYDATGALIDMVTIGETIMPSTGGQLDSAANPTRALPTDSSPSVVIQANPDPANSNSILSGLRDWLPASGLTPWDSGARIVWTPGGIIIAGTSALGTSRAPFTLALNEEFSMRWFTTHERENSDERLLDIVATADGLLAVGSSAQFLDMGAFNATANNGSALLMKLPFDGKIEFHPGAHCIHRFLQPGVHDTVHNAESLGIPSSDLAYHGTDPLTLTPATQATTMGYPTSALGTHTFTSWIPLEAGNANTPMTFTQWAAYQQLPAGLNGMNDDVDGDGRTNGQEWFFGGDPFTIQYGAPPFSMTRTPGGNLFFTMTKSHTAALHLPRLDSSIDLLNWSPVTLPSLTVTPLDAFTDSVSFVLPMTNEARRFYRAAAP